MLKDILFIVGSFLIAVLFGIMTIRKVVVNREGNIQKQEPIKRTVEMIDPNYDKKYGR
jgi:hypothetical protein